METCSLTNWLYGDSVPVPVAYAMPMDADREMTNYRLISFGERINYLILPQKDLNIKNL